MSMEMLEEIVRQAMPYMSTVKTRRQLSSSTGSHPADNDDIRACLVETEDWHVLSRRSVVFQILTFFPY